MTVTLIIYSTVHFTGIKLCINIAVSGVEISRSEEGTLLYTLLCTLIDQY
jgi:hypothetical protein